MAELEPTDRIGNFLVKIGAMSDEQVRVVLDEQTKHPERLFGEIAIERGYVDDAAIQAYLEKRGS